MLDVGVKNTILFVLKYKYKHIFLFIITLNKSTRLKKVNQVLLQATY